MPSPTDQNSGRPALQSPGSNPADSSVAGDTSTGASTGTASDIPFGAPSEANEVGTLGPYRVIRQLGRGGMGAVFLAVDTRLNRKLALKVMLPQYAADKVARERFLREAQAAAQIAHDNVVTVYEADQRDGVTYIAMQFLQGYPLDEYLKKKGRPGIPQVIRLAREAAAGLAAAHKLGLVHRDIKPANLWLEAPNGRVKVLDFGLAKPLDAQVEMTRTGMIMGTPAYMSPEQARGSKVDGRTDLFSLGAMLYQLCTGRLPFEGPNIMAVLTALATENPRPVRELNPDVPAALADLIHQLLAKKLEDRPATADEVVRRLRTVTEDQGQKSTPPGCGRPAAALTVTAAPQEDPWDKLDLMAVTPVTALSATMRRGAKRRQGSRTWIWGAVAAIGVAVAVAGVSLIGRMNRSAATNEPSTSAKDEERDNSRSLERVPSVAQQRPAASPDYGAILDQARAHAARREWKEAAEAYSEIIDQTIHEWGEVAFEYAAVLLLAGDRTTYKEVCAQLVERAGPPGVRAYHAARACTLAVDSFTPAERPAEMAQAELDRSGGTAYWWEWLQGAQHYRAGRYREALPLFQKSMDDSSQLPDGVVGIQMWMALTYHQLNRPDEARHAFEQAETWLANYSGGLPPEPERWQLRLHLHNWLEIHVMELEVRALLGQAL